MSIDKKVTSVEIRHLVTLGEIFSRVQGFQYKDREEFDGLYKIFKEILMPSIQRFYDANPYVGEISDAIEAVKDRMDSQERRLDTLEEAKENMERTGNFWIVGS